MGSINFLKLIYPGDMAMREREERDRSIQIHRE